MSAAHNIVIFRRPRRKLSVILLLGALTLVASVGWRSLSNLHWSPSAGLVSPENSSNLSSPCPLALAPHSGTDQVDREIARLQQEAKAASDPSRALERLGWMFVSKARISYDPGYYKLAEQCAVCMESRNPKSPEALLLHGHVLHSLHRFREAEVIARELVAKRGIPFDYGLLGDVLADQGDIHQAVEAYQKMMDLRPDLQSYTRAAHMRWITGDLKGAVELMRIAARSGSPRDPDSAAWAYSHLALYEFQAGNTKKAHEDCDEALSFQSNYAPALLVRGRMLIAEGKQSEAIELLKKAVTLNPLPEYQWILTDALRSVRNINEALHVEAQLLQHGSANDPRTFALYLATRGEQLDTALRLAQQELTVRGDVFTHDALAWTLATVGRTEEAHIHMEKALAEGTKDARLFFHAGVIAEMAGQKHEALQWLRKAYAIRQMLMPSERDQLTRHLAGN
jgi:tetratricopeptide (TPR) repeat protein